MIEIVMISSIWKIGSGKHPFTIKFYKK